MKFRCNNLCRLTFHPRFIATANRLCSCLQKVFREKREILAFVINVVINFQKINVFPFSKLRKIANFTPVVFPYQNLTHLILAGEHRPGNYTT
ncbi:MAG: hypothetical protein CR996_01435 [Draconibacterium sp.]|nr:MAG: hypothetical protein CR996_01435 [Draconibacterium sp.]PIF05571.1 MAG: hypothetical protein CSA36_06150 [Draconibacterium sp.]